MMRLNFLETIPNQQLIPESSFLLLLRPIRMIIPFSISGNICHGSTLFQSLGPTNGHINWIDDVGRNPAVGRRRAAGGREVIVIYRGGRKWIGRRWRKGVGDSWIGSNYWKPISETRWANPRLWRLIWVYSAYYFCFRPSHTLIEEVLEEWFNYLVWLGRNVGGRVMGGWVYYICELGETSHVFVFCFYIFGFLFAATCVNVTKFRGLCYIILILILINRGSTLPTLVY